MNKKIFFTFSIITMAYFSDAQTWSTFGTGIQSGQDVFGAGEYNGNLYVSGDFTTAGGNPAKYIAQWNGTSWSSVGSGFNNWGGLPMLTYNGNLIVGGTFTLAGGNPASKIAQWNGINWSSVGTGMNTAAWQVASLASYNGNLYAGGEFDSAGGQPASNIAEWNGTSWSALGLGIANSAHDPSVVYTLAVYNGELYAGGIFDTAGSVQAHDIAKWNGTSWSAVGSGIGHGTVSSLCVYEGNLYVGGEFDSAGGIAASNIAVWNGSTWSAAGGGIYGGNGVSALTVYNHELFAGGFFTGAGSYNTAASIAQWDGNLWSPSYNTNVVSINALCTYNDSLVAGGNFSQIGTLSSCNNIAELSGIQPMPASNICYVTVDTASKYNEVLWDKTSVDTVLVDSFRVYSKSFSSYKYLGSVSVHNFTQFVDSASQPNTVSSTYEISTVDTSGLISQLTSIYHQTILLQASVGVGNAVNLSWNPYVGDSVYYYLILRDSLGNGNWQRLDSVPNNIYAYTDNHPPVSPHLRYIVNTVWNLSCVPYSNSPIVRHQAMSTNRISSRSNRKEIVITGIQNVNSMPSVTIYPNPSKDMVTITLSEPVDAILTLNDMLGQTIYADKLNGNESIKQINLSGVKDGVYFLKLSLNNGGELVRKIEVVR